MRELVLQNTTSKIIAVFIHDSTTGLGKTGVAAASMAGQLVKGNAAGSSLSFSSGSVGDSYSSGKWAEIGNGAYYYHAPNGTFADLGMASLQFQTSGGIIVPIRYQIVAFNPNAVAVGANTTAPDNTGIADTLTQASAAASSAASAATSAASAATSAASADTKLSTGRLSRIDRLPDVNAGASGGIALVGSAMTLDSATLAALFADADVAGMLADWLSNFDDDTDVPVDTMATLAASKVLAALLANGTFTTLFSDAAAAKTASAAVNTRLPATPASQGDVTSATSTITTAITSSTSTITSALSTHTTTITSAITTTETTILEAIDGIEGGGGGGLTGPYKIKITVTGDGDPLEGARVRVYRTGYSQSLETDADGYVEFAVTAHTWEIAITHARFAGDTDSVAVTSADVTRTYDLTPMTYTPSVTGRVTGFYITYDERGEVEAGVDVGLTMTDAPGYNAAHDEKEYVVTSGVDGVAEFTNLVPGAMYAVRRGVSERRFMARIPTDAESPCDLISIIGGEE